MTTGFSETGPAASGSGSAPAAAGRIGAAVFGRFFELLPEAALLVGATGQVVAANRAACATLRTSEAALASPGAVRGAVVARPGEAGPSPIERAGLRPALAAPVGGEAVRLMVERADGSRFPAEVRTSRFLDEAGQPVSAVVFRDVSAAEEVEARVEAIGELTRSLLAGQALETVLAMTAGHARRLVGASVAWVTRLTADAEAVEVLAGDGERSGDLVGRRYAIASTPTGRALRSGGAVFVDDLSREAGAAGEARRLGLGPTLVVPLRGDGHSFGSLVVAAEADHARFDAGSVEVVQLYADAAAVALALGAARAELERVPLDVLQRATLPASLPVLDRARLAARYVPSHETDLVGGDWYDALAWPDGRAVLVVGDVAGRGLSAAALTAQVRNTLRAFLLDGAEPATALAKVDACFATLRSDPVAPMATAVVAVVDPGTSRLTFALAGHLPPAVAAPGRARFLVGARPGPPLGVVPGGSGYEETSVPLEAGATVVLLTDGLVERRGEPIDEGLERVRGVLATLVGTTAGLEASADRLMAELGSGSDDRCLLLCRLLGEAAPGDPSPGARAGLA